jgi:signal transduction histidine kinase
MLRRLVPAGLRAQLTIVIAAVMALGVGASFLAVYGVTGSRLRAQIDSQLRTQMSEWRQFTARGDLSSARALERMATRFIAGQRYHAESLLIVVQPVGGATVSNNPGLLVREEARERSVPEATELLDSPSGLATASVAEAGGMRVLSTPIRSANRVVGTLRVASPLTPVRQAQSSLRRSFFLVGALALLVAIGVAIVLARLIAAPLRRMAGVAATVDAGDLSTRADTTSTRGEVGVLADAFDHMLDRLERAFKRQRDFVSDASHELRTPLSVLRAQVELLDHERDEDKRHESIVTLLRRVDGLDHQLGDMLTLASAEAGQLIEPQTIDVHDFFEDLRRDLPLFGERTFLVDAVDGTLQADPDRLTQVLRNLVRNAVAHTKPGDRIAVRARAHDDQLDISVSDTGVGIPPGELDRIFERFHRVDGAQNPGRGGSGLGLAIARAIVEAHGGTIGAESVPGESATLQINLPGYRPTGTPLGDQPWPYGGATCPSRTGSAASRAARIPEGPRPGVGPEALE